MTSLAGKFVVLHTIEDDDCFYQAGEIVEQVGERALVKWDRFSGGGCPHDDAMILFSVADMTTKPGEGASWEFFATREQLDAYKAHLGIPTPEEGDDDEVGSEVIAFPGGRPN